MIIKKITTLCSAELNLEHDKIYDLPDSIAEELIKNGYATSEVSEKEITKALKVEITLEEKKTDNNETSEPEIDNEVSEDNNETSEPEHSNNTTAKPRRGRGK